MRAASGARWACRGWAAAPCDLRLQRLPRCLRRAGSGLPRGTRRPVGLAGNRAQRLQRLHGHHLARRVGHKHARPAAQSHTRVAVTLRHEMNHTLAICWITIPGGLTNANAPHTRPARCTSTHARCHHTAVTNWLQMEPHTCCSLDHVPGRRTTANTPHTRPARCTSTRARRRYNA